jgi:heme iron utilization protein
VGLPGSDEVRHLIRRLLQQQRLAVLATSGGGGPYGSLVAFASDQDLRNLVFATSRATRKYSNLLAASSVALVVDNRENSESDFHEAVAVTALGKATEVTDDERVRWAEVYARKHPHLSDFISSPTSALFVVEIDRYYVVSKFQNVVEMDPRTWNTL